MGRNLNIVMIEQVVVGHNQAFTFDAMSEMAGFGSRYLFVDFV
jgi:hypothetical protein